ncbi:MAG: pyridoxal-phosphate dependent enzyme [Chitinophagaceae bacterium]|nr:pyridoxal-phosphate dependent enzyme [Chitinophagaceae bacterium]
MQDIHLNKIAVDPVNLPIFSDNNISADVLRLDKIHPLISGNKWFKLRYYLDEAIQEGKKRILTSGGAWSNHILAAAAAGQLYGFKTTGKIRGEEPAELSPILQQAKAMGMELVFMSRENYGRERRFIEKKRVDLDSSKDLCAIPEGGCGIKGAEGAATILEHCTKENYTHICCAVGTGTMTAGLARGASLTTTIIAVSVLKNNPEIEKIIHALLPGSSYEKRIRLLHDYHFGGYAKHKPELLDFMNEFYRQTSIPSDFVYTGKLFYAITDLAAKKYFPTGSRLLLIHSGGLQGNSSLDKGTLIF